MRTNISNAPEGANKNAPNVSNTPLGTIATCAKSLEYPPLLVLLISVLYSQLGLLHTKKPPALYQPSAPVLY